MSPPAVKFGVKSPLAFLVAFIVVIGEFRAGLNRSKLTMRLLNNATSGINSFLSCKILFVLLLVFVMGSTTVVAQQSDFIRTSRGDQYPIAGFDRARGPDQLIIYTPDFGPHTTTNRWGVEVVVRSGSVTEIHDEVSEGPLETKIPLDGFVISAHGAARDWILENIEADNKVEIVNTGPDYVGILVSEYNMRWYNQMGLSPPHWEYFEELNNVVAVVRELGYPVLLVSDEQLERTTEPSNSPSGKRDRISDVKTLILPNTRRMSGGEVESVKEFVERGGTVLAFMQSSLMDENDKFVRDKDYQLKDLFQVSFKAFSAREGQHAYILNNGDHPIWRGIEGKVANTTGWAMVNRLLPNGKKLGKWAEDNEFVRPHRAELNAAIVEGKNTIYIGAQLLAPPNFDPTTKKLLKNAIKYLYHLSPAEEAVVSTDQQVVSEPEKVPLRSAEKFFQKNPFLGIVAVIAIVGLGYNLL